MTVTQNSEYRGVNRITRDDFRTLLAANAAPAVLAERDAGEYWDAIQRYDADALFIAAIFQHESQMGKKGTATQTHSWGNTRTPNFGAQSIGTVKGRSGTFPAFANWLDGCISTVARLTDPTWVYAKGDRTIGEVFTLEPSWAPAGDMNDPAGYLRAVLDFMNAHTSKETTVAQTDDPLASWFASSNYDAGRAGKTIEFIILHTTEGSFASALGWLRGAASGSSNRESSSHYLIPADGSKIAQLVREADTAWAAGNLDYNRRGVNIEQEGYANRGGFSDTLYQATGALVGRIARRHSVPLDRQHVIGHMDVPDPRNPALKGGIDHHHDPGPHYDFDRVIAIAKGITGVTENPNTASQSASRWFPETRHYLSLGFRAFWESYGDKAIPTFGYPLSEEFTENGKTVQYLERARFEINPKATSNPWHVELGRVAADDAENAKSNNPKAFADAEPPK